MSHPSLTDVMARFEARFDLSFKEQSTLYDERDAKIQQVLAAWAEKVPQWAKDQYQYRLERVIDFCLHRRFTHVFHNTRTGEVIVAYGDRIKPEMSISITRENILARDPESKYAEILFPISWPTDSPEHSFFAIEEVSQISAVEW